MACPYFDPGERLPWSSGSLGDLYAGGRGVATDLPRAAVLYRRACDGDSPEGCTSLAAMFENGRGMAVDINRAIGLYTRGCDGGLSAACDARRRLTGR